jgi:hypothetical protein
VLKVDEISQVLGWMVIIPKIATEVWSLLQSLYFALPVIYKNQHFSFKLMSTPFKPICIHFFLNINRSDLWERSEDCYLFLKFLDLHYFTLAQANYKSPFTCLLIKADDGHFIISCAWQCHLSVCMWLWVTVSIVILHLTAGNHFDCCFIFHCGWRLSIGSSNFIVGGMSVVALNLVVLGDYRLSTRILMCLTTVECELIFCCSWCLYCCFTFYLVIGYEYTHLSYFWRFSYIKNLYQLTLCTEKGY